MIDPVRLVTALGVAIALLGTVFTSAGVVPWPRFWAAVFFVLLFWPIGLHLAARLGGRRAFSGLAAILVLGSIAQQSGFGTMPLPQRVRWSVTLMAPGDAIRQRIALPPPSDRLWKNALSHPYRPGITVCTWEPVAPDSGVTVSFNGTQPVALTALPRFGDAGGWGWYVLDVPVALLRQEPVLDVVIRKDGVGSPVRICGGRDDPRRRGAGDSSRLVNGEWLATSLSDPFLSSTGASMENEFPGRYYVELRLFDAEGHASGGIWY